MAKLITRHDKDVGVGSFDSIKWAFSEHVKSRDNKRYKSALLYGNEDAPYLIEFFVSANPRYDAKPDYVWPKQNIPIKTNPPKDKWIPTSAVKFNVDGSVSMRTSNPSWRKYKKAWRKGWGELGKGKLERGISLDGTYTQPKRKGLKRKKRNPKNF
jgi:hypothetical protein